MLVTSYEAAVKAKILEHIETNVWHSDVPAVRYRAASPGTPILRYVTEISHDTTWTRLRREYAANSTCADFPDGAN
ncbi:hypothetical protein DACRYDRAFT_21989, partial [Dacryopinax primogenitus]